MSSAEIRQPPEVLQCLEEMREKQNALNTKRLDLLNSLRYEKQFDYRLIGRTSAIFIKLPKIVHLLVKS